MTSIANILGLIDSGNYAIPVFQRGYVWNRDQVKKLMNSLYNGYPIGILLVWNTTTDPTIARGDGELVPGNVNMILDGQQRITSPRCWNNTAPRQRAWSNRKVCSCYRTPSLLGDIYMELYEVKPPSFLKEILTLLLVYILMLKKRFSNFILQQK